MGLAGIGYRYIKGRKRSYKSLQAEERAIQKRLTKARLKGKIKREKSELFKMEHSTLAKTGESLNKSITKSGKKLAKDLFG